MNKSSQRTQPKTSAPRKNFPVRLALAFLSLPIAVFLITFTFAKVKNYKSSPTQKALVETEKLPDELNPFFYRSIGGSNPTEVQSVAQPVEKYTVNIKTFATQAEAEAMLKELTKAGLMGFYTPVRQADKVFYHVRIGIFSDERDAAKTIATVQKKTNLTGSVAKLQ